jgi:hypothetical protein
MLCIKRLVPVGSAHFCPSVAPLALASAVSSWLGTSAVREAPGKITFTPWGTPPAASSSSPSVVPVLVPERFEPGRRPLSLVPAPEEVTPTSSMPRVDLRAELDRLTRALIIWMGYIVAITGIVAFLAGRFV